MFMGRLMKETAQRNKGGCFGILEAATITMCG